MTTLYTASIDDEPPVGTAVVDGKGIVWQHLTDRIWSRAFGAGHSDLGYSSDPHHSAHLQWPILLTVHGQMREVYTPPPVTKPVGPGDVVSHPPLHYPPGVRGSGPFQPTSEILESARGLQYEGDDTSPPQPMGADPYVNESSCSHTRALQAAKYGPTDEQLQAATR